jgi:hypothetical protein
MSRFHNRKVKSYVSSLYKQLGRKRYFEDCNYHVCRVTSRTLFRGGQDGDLEGVSLFTDKPSGCSLFHCAPLPLTEEEAMERLTYFKEHGMDEYQRKYVYAPMTDEEWIEVLVSIHKFRNEWRDGAI